ncbi:MAG: 3-dehydroquinate synthase [Bacteroidetes bacterium]|nr:3-dehydroquinate synthase [Bacteroidota bacterium]
MIKVIKFGLKAFPPFFKINTYSSVFVLVDENSRKHCLPLLVPYLPGHQIIQIKSGEKHKTLTSCEFIWASLLKKQADRNSLLINLGGGVITDIGAFCASVFMRGVDFVNVPTSLLAMTDAAVGGKTGVDFLNFKNMIGTFSEPKLLCIDPEFLKTLPQKQMLSASAEIFKHALLQNKKEVKKHLENPFVQATEAEILRQIKNSNRFKWSVVSKDSMDKNIRQQLNLGHTIAHALESYFIAFKKPLLHGEAVALGLVGEAFIAHCFYNLSYECFLNIVYWYDLNFKKPELKELNFNTLLKWMQKDKKSINSELQLVLLEKEGSVTMNNVVSHSQLKLALKFLVDF